MLDDKTTQIIGLIAIGIVILSIVVTLVKAKRNQPK